MPFVCQARYVGQEGVNFTPETFARKGYGAEAIFPEEQADFAWPAPAQLRAMVDQERKPMEQHCVEVYAGRDLPAALRYLPRGGPPLDPDCPDTVRTIRVQHFPSQRFTP